MSKVNGTADKGPPPQDSSLQADIALLASLLSDDANEEIDDTSISELLRKLDTAHGVASGVESRLDEILNNLDGLLGSLESAAAADVSRSTKDAVGTVAEKPGDVGAQDA